MCTHICVYTYCLIHRYSDIFVSFICVPILYIYIHKCILVYIYIYIPTYMYTDIFVCISCLMYRCSDIFVSFTCIHICIYIHPPKNGLIALQTPRTSRLSTFNYCQVVNRALLRLLSTYILV